MSQPTTPAELTGAVPTIPMKRGYLTVLVISYLALYLAWIAPIGFSMAVRVEALGPQNKDAVLPIVLGISGVIALVGGPIVGILSDRTRLRFGKRRTWMLGGMLAGLIGSVLVGVAPSTGLLIAAWSFAYLGYTATGAMFLTHLSDRLPPAQQGRVAGFTGAVTQVAPVLGVAIAGAFVESPVAMFAVPAGVAFVFGLVFVFVMKDEPAGTASAAVNLRQILRGYYFNPRRHPNFAWVWISRALMFLALSFMQVYQVYLLAAKLHLDTAAIAAIVATVGLLSVLFAIGSSIVSGALSDKLGTRRPFIIMAGLLLATGLVLIGTVSSIPQFYIGTIVATTGIGAFGAIDQAIGLDNLPTDQGENGRFIGIFNL
ncbi:MAG: MFS transporter, partial [Candidatus Microbacterium stercoravium]